MIEINKGEKINKQIFSIYIIKLGLRENNEKTLAIQNCDQFGFDYVGVRRYWLLLFRSDERAEVLESDSCRGSQNPRQKLKNQGNDR